jgi:hypothetical protein
MTKVRGHGGVEDKCAYNRARRSTVGYTVH